MHPWSMIDSTLSPGRLAVVTIVVASAFFMPSCDGSSVDTDTMLMKAEEESRVVALVGRSPISDRSFRRHLARAGADLAPERLAEKKQAVLDELIRTKALAVAGRKAGYADDPEIVEVVDRMVADRYLRDLMELNPAEPPEITDDDVAAYYAEHRDDFSQPGRARASLVLLLFPASADAASRETVRARAATLREQAAASDAAGFGDLARVHSEHRFSRDRGGDLGWLLEGGRDYRVPEPIAAAVFALAVPGDVSPLVEFDRGVGFVRLVERHRAEPKPLADVAPTIREIRRAEALRRHREEVIDRLVAELGVEIHQDVLNSIESSGPSTGKNANPPSFPVSANADGESP